MRRFVVLLLAAAVLAGGLVIAATLAVSRDDLRPAVTQAAKTARDTARQARDTARRATRAPAVPIARCPADADGDCRSVRGRIVFVERVDPDGDGDLHVVVADGSVTAPGLTSIDVRPGLRPTRDPRVGDVATAAGPVQRGSIGQQQIHALVFLVGRAS